MSNTLPTACTASAQYRRIGFVALAIALMSSSVSVGDEQDQAHYAAWVVSYGQAVQESKETGRPIMLFFTGSDWCSWCTQLTHEVFTTREFARWSTDNVIKVEVDFPQGYSLPAEVQVQNENLKAQFGHHVQTYPTILFVNAEGELLGKTGYVSGGAVNWVESANQMVSPSTPQNSDMLAQTNN